MQVVAPVSWGELIDKITILEIKLEKLKPGAQRDNVKREHDALVAVRDRHAQGSWQAAAAELKSINEILWQVEDDIRDCERDKDFGAKFVELARSVYKTNDKRAAVKRRLNEAMGSELVEEKLYKAY